MNLVLLNTDQPFLQVVNFRMQTGRVALTHALTSLLVLLIQVALDHVASQAHAWLLAVSVLMAHPLELVPVTVLPFAFCRDWRASGSGGF